MKNFWISWWHPHPDEAGRMNLGWPWWVSGYRGMDDEASLCAAVQASDEATAMEIITEAYPEKPVLEFRFCEERPADWVPWSDRFPQLPGHKDWVQP